ncbi:hypothetical protein OAF54_00870 [bacterium]|nr:hypothetical protein [bacterium]
MRQPLLDNRRLQQTAEIFSLPSPTGGWNARDNLAAMPTLDAVKMVNFFPEVDGVTLRKGDVLFASGLSGEVEFLFEYEGATSNDLLAASDGNFYDITSGTPSTIGSGLTNAQWQGENYNARAFFVNGADAPKDWNGTTLASTSWTGSGLTIADLINVQVIRDRLWFVEKDSGNAWYGGIGSITGTLTKFNIGEIARSGTLMAIGSWSRDSGDGQDDYTVFIMDTGECLAYQGDVSSTFTLVGRYNAPEPIGRRCIINWGGELVIITRSGYLGLTGIMDGKIKPDDAISEKIREAVAEAVENGGSIDGWAAMLSPDGRKLIFNVPVTDSSVYHQHVINTITGAWGKWEDRNMRSMGTLDNEMYGGFGSGNVYRIEDGRVDASAGFSVVKGVAKQASNSLVAPDRPLDGTKKEVTMLRPFVRGGGNVSLTMDVQADFSDLQLVANNQSLSPNSEPWETYDVFDWEVWELPWGDGAGIASTSLTVGAVGETFSIVLDAETAESLVWYSTDVIYRRGGII